MKIILLALTFLVSCSHLRGTGEPSEGKYVYTYTDVSGEYRLQRDVKIIKKKLVTRTQILSPSGGSNNVVEKSVTVSQIGTVKEGKGRSLVLRPLASEFTVWLEGKKYSSRMQLNNATKAMRVTLNSPETKWQGQNDITFPRGKHFCFYSQIPECLYHNQMLLRAKENKKQSYDFYIVWDNYPYVQEQLNQVGKDLFAPATVKYDGELKGRIRYIIDVDEQVILYQFTKNFELAGQSWISQGIMVARPGEEIKSDEE